MELKTVATRHVPVRSLEGGSGPDLVYLHGAGGVTAEDPFLAELAKSHHVYAPLIPGYGDSEECGEIRDMLDFTLHSWDVVEALGLKDPILVGHSMGAAIAALAAAGVPARVERLALLETLGPLAEAEENTAHRLQQAVAATRGRPGAPLRVFPELSVAVRARIQASPMDEAGARLLVERGTRAVEGGYAWRSDRRLVLPAATRLTEAQVRVLLAAVSCPVQVLYADPAQPYFPEDVRHARLDALPQAALAVLPGGHHLHMDQPAAVAAVLGAFMAG